MKAATRPALSRPAGRPTISTDKNWPAELRGPVFIALQRKEWQDSENLSFSQIVSLPSEFQAGKFSPSLFLSLTKENGRNYPPKILALFNIISPEREQNPLLKVFQLRYSLRPCLPAQLARFFRPEILLGKGEFREKREYGDCRGCQCQ